MMLDVEFWISRVDIDAPIYPCSDAQTLLTSESYSSYCSLADIRAYASQSLAIVHSTIVLLSGNRSDHKSTRPRVTLDLHPADCLERENSELNPGVKWTDAYTERGSVFDFCNGMMIPCLIVALPLPIQLLFASH